MKRKLKILLILVLSVALLLVAAVLMKDFILFPAQNPDNQSGTTIEYGIVTDSFKVITDEVKKGETLAAILSGLGVNESITSRLNKYTVTKFDLRKLKQGNNYTAMFDTNRVGQLTYFIYEISDTNYVVFDFRDSLHVHLGNKEVTRHLRSASGKIRSSLWNAIMDAKADPNLAISLANIYQWTIDFYAIQKDDEFKAIYEELSVDGKPVGMGTIHAAWFRHAGKEYYAYRFEDDEKSDYYDENGQNLRREFLKAPLKFSRITSRFSNSRLHPVLRIRRPHHGVDYAAPTGTPVHTIGAGIVTKAAYAGGAGRMVYIKHNNGFATSYMHLSGFASGIRQGNRVSQGQLIGYVGSTGLSTGPHLDFRVYKNGVAIDPLKIESPPALPVPSGLKAKFESQIQAYANNLNLINAEYRSQSKGKQ